MSAVRRAVVDGLFYAAARYALRAQVASYLAGVGADDDAARPPPKLLITPHAGYEYCGAVAARAYALLGRRPVISRAVLLGRAHRIHLRGLAAPEVDGFETPWARSRSTSPCSPASASCRRWCAAHEREHSLEVQLPFLQTFARQLHPRAAGRR